MNKLLSMGKIREVMEDKGIIRYDKNTQKSVLMDKNKNNLGTVRWNIAQSLFVKNEIEQAAEMEKTGYIFFISSK